MPLPVMMYQIEWWSCNQMLLTLLRDHSSRAIVIDNTSIILSPISTWFFCYDIHSKTFLLTARQYFGDKGLLFHLLFDGIQCLNIGMNTFLHFNRSSFSIFFFGLCQKVHICKVPYFPVDVKFIWSIRIELLK